MASRATSSCRSASLIAWCTWSTSGIRSVARSRAAAMAASNAARASRSRLRWANGSVLTPAGGRAARAACSSPIASATRRERGSSSATARSRRDSSTTAASVGLRSQRLDLEGLHRIEQRRCSAHRFSGCLERDVRLLALTGRTPPLGHAHAVLGESEQLIGLRRVGLHVDERLPRIAGGEAFDGLAGVRDASAQTLDVGSHAGDDLGCTPRPRDPVGERGGLLIEHVLGRFAQLHDAHVAGPHLVGGAGDRIVIEPVQTERVAQVPAHRDERLAQLRGRVGAQLRLGEAELVGGDADALVGGEQGRFQPASPDRRRGPRVRCAPRLRLTRNPAMLHPTVAARSPLWSGATADPDRLRGRSSSSRSAAARRMRHVSEKICTRLREPRAGVVDADGHEERDRRNPRRPAAQCQEDDRGDERDDPQDDGSVRRMAMPADWVSLHG